MNIPLILCISMAMFSIGMIGILIKRNVLLLFLCIELMLNAANLLFVAFAYHWGDVSGLLWVFFVLIVAAAEAAVGFAIIIQIFRSKQVVDVDQYDTLKG